MSACARACVCVRACVRARVWACMRARVQACARACLHLLASGNCETRGNDCSKGRDSPHSVSMALRLPNGLGPAILRALVVRSAIERYPDAANKLQAAAFKDEFTIAMDILNPAYEWGRHSLRRNVGEVVANMHLSLGDSDAQTRVVAEAFTAVMRTSKSDIFRGGNLWSGKTLEWNRVEKERDGTKA